MKSAQKDNKSTKIVNKDVKKKNTKVLNKEPKKTEIVIPNVAVKEKDKKIEVIRIIKLLLNILFWVIIILLAIVWIVDYIRVANEKKPVFCINNEIHEYEDGKVKACTGLGYKVYTYDRESIGNGIQFGSFFTKIKEPNNK